MNNKSADHLGTDIEVTKFVQRMKQELDKHRVDKTPMRNWTTNAVLKNNIPQIHDRIIKINKLFREIENSIYSHKTMTNLIEISKQFVHIGNYSMMGFIKAEEELEREGSR